MKLRILKYELEHKDTVSEKVEKFIIKIKLLRTQNTVTFSIDLLRDLFRPSEKKIRKTDSGQTPRVIKYFFYSDISSGNNWQNDCGRPQ